MADNQEQVKFNQVQGDDFDSLLSVETSDITNDPVSSGSDPDFFRPSLKAKNLKDGEYKTWGRFVPDVNNKLHLVSKWIYLLRDSASDDGKFYVDCTSNAAAATNKNIITNAFFALKDHGSKVYKDMAKEFFSRKRMHWAPFYIINDSQDPDNLNRKIKIFRFGNQVYDPIQTQDKEDLANNKKSVKVMDVFLTPGRQGGRDFHLVIKEVTGDNGKKMPSYISSYFDGSETANFSFDGRERLEPTQENKKKITDFLRENTPDMTKVLFKPWDNEFEQKVIESVKFTIGDPDIFNTIYAKTYGKRQFTGTGSSEPQGGNFVAQNDNFRPNESKAQAVSTKDSVAELASKVATPTASAPATSAPAPGQAPRGNTPNASAPTSSPVDDSVSDEMSDDLGNFNFDDLNED